MSGGPLAQAPGAESMHERLTRQQVVSFLENGIAVMRREEVLADLKDRQKTKNLGQRLIELQRAQWDPLGVDQDFGCSFVDKLEEHFPGDKDLIMKRNEFVLAAKTTYVACAEGRKPAKLERKRAMPREAIIEFFDVCNTRMELPDTRKRLLEHLQEKKEMPNQLIIDIQRDLLEVIGFEREHGCRCLSNIGQNFPNDKELHQRFQMWQGMAQGTCMTVVKAHQAMGGELPGCPAMPGFDAPEADEMRRKAIEAIEAMTPLERGELLTKMEKKVQVFANLPPEGRQSYLQRLSEADRLMFVKAQILLQSHMKQQWEAQQKQMQGWQDGKKEEPDPPKAAPPEAPPEQQSM